MNTGVAVYRALKENQNHSTEFHALALEFK